MFKIPLNKYTRSLYQNINRKIYIIAFASALILVIWTLISSLFGKNKEETNVTKNTSLYKPAETVISGKDITESAYEEDKNLINTFIDYCNNGNVEEAYNLLSSDCKEALYNTKEDFINYYYNEVFATKREYNLQSWISNGNYHTYRVRMIDDIMSTGDYENSSNFQDYMTIMKDGNNKYLSIGQYISKEELKNKTQETDELLVSVDSAETYISYVEYSFSIQNKTDKVILMDTLENVSETMYLELSNNLKRTCNAEGLSNISLRIDPYCTKNIKIKYNKSAGASDNKVKKIHFLNVIKDYEMYIKNKESYNDILELSINL